MTHGARLAFFGVRSRYEGADSDAIHDINLTVESGALVVLVGPSGCGKTTLLRTVNRLAPVTAGRIEIDGVDTASLEPVAMRRSIGYAIQAIGLFAHMNVAENVAVVPSLLQWDRARIDARVDEMLALVRLDPARYRHRRPSQLSGGEAQRVGVARALAAEPRVLLMDEPFGALDAIVRRELQSELAQIVKSVGTTTLFVTHDVDESLRLADRIVVLNRGAIEQNAPPLEILSHPATPFVRELFADDPAIARLRERARARS
ncbi:MAG TPA: ATP-binding cassette domain-containing protein [Candidatus Baltobacteraceae bacterium]|nr:ATP-binding cassette domain-containing protein [Candidatus Baltobacteraceae bacterium]